MLRSCLVLSLLILITACASPDPLPATPQPSSAQAETATPVASPASALVPSTPVTTPGTDNLTVVSDFYNWYLAYAGAPDSSQGRNPLRERAYRDYPALAPAFVAETDRLWDDFEYDPFLRHGAVPDHFTVETGVDEDTVIVNLYYDERPWLVLVTVDDQGQITHIAQPLSSFMPPPAP